MRLWVLFKFYEDYCVWGFVCLFYQATNQLRVKPNYDMPFGSCGPNVSSVFEVSAVLFESVLHMHQPGASLILGRLSNP